MSVYKDAMWKERLSRRTFIANTAAGSTLLALVPSIPLSSLLTGTLILTSQELVGRGFHKAAYSGSVMYLEGGRIDRFRKMVSLLRDNRPVKIVLNLDATDLVLFEIAVDQCDARFQQAEKSNFTAQINYGAKNREIV